ncbi:MAG: helix-turn-helix domain-containing protein [bacterium]|jgi:IS30 family transposase
MSNPIKLDWDQIGKWLEAGCSGSEIADVLGCHENTIYNRCKDDLDVDFVAFKAKNKAKGMKSLRLAQYESAVIDKDRGMQIWLGKQWLGQSDKSQTEISMPELKQVIISPNGNTEQSNLADPSGV